MMISDKKSNEQLCLDRVIRAKKLLHGESKHIINKISGSEMDREIAERPDFVRYFAPVSKHEKAILIGIEHFRVDHLSVQKKDGKVASMGIATEKEVHKIYKQWHEEVITSDKVIEGAISDIANLIAMQIQRKKKSSYNTFIRSFEYSLDKHLQSVDAYRTNLQKLSRGKYNIELALLIEIHSEFKNLFLNNQKGVYKQENGFIPIFEDMIRLIEKKVDCHKVNYIILCMGETLYTENPKVIAIRTTDIRERMKRQNIIIYEYVGEDLIFTDFQATQRNITVEPKYLIDGDKISFGIESTDQDQDEQFMLNSMFYSLKKALEYRKQGKNFVTTLGTQMMLEVLGDYVIGWQQDKEKVRPIISGDLYINIHDKMIEFEKKWNLQRGEEQNEQT